MKHLPEIRTRAIRSTEQRIATISDQPVRQIRERREAFDKMFSMINHIRDYAAQTGKRGLVVGSGFYVATDGTNFTVYRNGETFFEKSLMRVVALFDPLEFTSGHLQHQ